VIQESLHFQSRNQKEQEHPVRALRWWPEPGYLQGKNQKWKVPAPQVSEQQMSRALGYYCQKRNQMQGRECQEREPVCQERVLECFQRKYQELQEPVPLGQESAVRVYFQTTRKSTELVSMGLHQQKLQGQEPQVQEYR
jgi:hypothetical protein